MSRTAVRDARPDLAGCCNGCGGIEDAFESGASQSFKRSLSMANDFAFYLYCAALVLPYLAVAVGLVLVLLPRRDAPVGQVTARRAA